MRAVERSATELTSANLRRPRPANCSRPELRRGRGNCVRSRLNSLRCSQPRNFYKLQIARSRGLCLKEVETVAESCVHGGIETKRDRDEIGTTGDRVEDEARGHAIVVTLRVRHANTLHLHRQDELQSRSTHVRDARCDPPRVSTSSRSVGDGDDPSDPIWATRKCSRGYSPARRPTRLARRDCKCQ